MPATPSATSTSPSRHGRPNVSVMTTPTIAPAKSRTERGAQPLGRGVGVHAAGA